MLALGAYITTPGCVLLGFKHRALCIRSKHSVNRATSSAQCFQNVSLSRSALWALLTICSLFSLPCSPITPWEASVSDKKIHTSYAGDRTWSLQCKRQGFDHWIPSPLRSIELYYHFPSFKLGMSLDPNCPSMLVINFMTTLQTHGYESTDDTTFSCLNYWSSLPASPHHLLALSPFKLHTLEP